MNTKQAELPKDEATQWEISGSQLEWLILNTSLMNLSRIAENLQKMPILNRNNGHKSAIAEGSASTKLKMKTIRRQVPSNSCNYNISNKSSWMNSS